MNQLKIFSSVITGTGTEPYNSINPTIVNLHGEYSHLELFESGFTSDNYTLKIFSFNVSKENSNIIINFIYFVLRHPDQLSFLKFVP